MIQKQVRERIEVILLSGMILKQEKERKLVKDFKSSGTILKQEGKLVKGFCLGRYLRE